MMMMTTMIMMNYKLKSCFLSHE